MESQIDFEVARSNYDLLQNLSTGEIRSIAKASRVQLLDFLEISSPREMIHAVVDLFQIEDADELTPFAAARLFGHGPIHSQERFSIARVKHQEAIDSGQYESLLESCDNAPDDAPKALVAMFKAEILEQIAVQEASIKIDCYMRENPAASDDLIQQQYYLYYNNGGFMRASIESRKTAISLGMKDNYPKLIYNLRDICAGEEMVNAFKEMVISSAIAPNEIKGIIQGVIGNEDQMVEVVEMIKFAVANGYPEAVNALSTMWDINYRDNRINEAEFYRQIGEIPGSQWDSSNMYQDREVVFDSIANDGVSEE